MNLISRLKEAWTDFVSLLKGWAIQDHLKIDNDLKLSNLSIIILLLILIALVIRFHFI